MLGKMLLLALLHSPTVDRMPSRLDCEVVAARLASTSDAREVIAAADSMRRACPGSVQGRARADAARRLRHLNDPAVLNRLWRGLTDRNLFEAALDVAADRQASQPVRVRAIVALYEIRNPTGQLLPSPPAGGAYRFVGPGPRGGCDYRRLAHAYRTVGAPLEPGDGDRAHALLDRIWRDETEPVEIRALALCAR